MKVNKIEHSRYDFDGVDIWKKYDEEHYDTFVLKGDSLKFLFINVHDDGEVIYH